MDDPHSNSVDPQSKSNEPPAEAPQQPPVIPQIPPPITRNAERAYSNPDPTPLWKIILETGAVFVGIGVAIIYYCQMNTMQRQLEMTDRPWIKDTVAPASDLLANNGAFSWAVSIKLDNVGHSVATNIYPMTKLIAPQGADFIDGPRRQVVELCKDASRRAINLKKDATLWDTSVFPSDPIVTFGSPILFPKDISQATVDGGENLGKSVSIMLIGCIAYDYPTASRFHETGFVYLLVHNDDTRIPEPTRVFFSLDKTIPKDKLVMIKKGQFAN